MSKKVEYKNGYEDTYYTCSECGHTEKQQINKIHYGNDEIKR